MIYRATRTERGPVVTVHKNERSKGRPLTHIKVHSPRGFEWGYGGSGPADLSIALLARHVGELPAQVLAYWNRPLGGGYRGKKSLAIDLHQRFKDQVIAKWPHNGAEITDEEIGAILSSWL